MNYPLQFGYGSLGAATGAGGLGTSRLVGDNEIVVPDVIYTFRTWSKVPINPEREVELRIPPARGTSGFGILPVLATAAVGWLTYRGVTGDTAWEAAETLGWRVAAPRGHASFWQNVTRQQSPAGWMGYQTSLNITPTQQGVKASALKWAARRILSFMSGSGSPDDVSNIWTGNLYERSVRADSAGLLRRASEAVLGRETTRAATELGAEIATEAEAAVMGSVAEQERREAAHKERMIYGYVGAGIAALLGIFLATRKGSAKVERKVGGAAERVAGVVDTTRERARSAAGASLGFPMMPMQNRRRRNGKRFRVWQRIGARNFIKRFATAAAACNWAEQHYGETASNGAYLNDLVVDERMADGSYRTIARVAY